MLGKSEAGIGENKVAKLVVMELGTIIGSIIIIIIGRETLLETKDGWWGGGGVGLLGMGGAGI